MLGGVNVRRGNVGDKYKDFKCRQIAAEWGWINRVLQMQKFCSIISVTATWPSGKAEACKAFIPGSNPGVALYISTGFYFVATNHIIVGYGYTGIK